MSPPLGFWFKRLELRCRSTKKKTYTQFCTLKNATSRESFKKMKVGKEITQRFD